MRFRMLRKSERKHLTWWSLSILVIWIGIQQPRVSEASTFDGDEWSAWSSWTPCSRTCDGGITQQFRRCKSPNGCHGVSIRRKMCNMQPCTERRDYRSEQCKAFNGREYKGLRRTWEAVEDPENPCASTCRAEGTDIIAKLSAKLKDGTLCRPGTLHVCVDGRCEPVGCDLKLGSPKTVDECGVCGGDGTSCTTQIYRWAIIPAGPCSTTCGGGHQSVKVICRNSLTEEKVEQFLCNTAQKPHRIFQNCNIHPCEPEWQTGEWISCSVKCGGGLRIRRVFCAQEKNASKIQVAEKHCQHVPKPPNQEQCNPEPCPHWHVGPWSSCSTLCGTEGVRTRNVVCRDAHNLPSSMCDLRLLPAASKACEDSLPCPTFPTTTTSTAPNPPTIDPITPTSSESISESQSELEFESEYIEEELPREHTLPLIQPYPPMDNAVMFDRNAVPSEPTKVRVSFACGWLYMSFVAEIWGPCSQTCGEGVRRREVNCKIFLEFTRTIANLPDKECPGPKPPETESCFARPCPASTDKDSVGVESLSDSHHAALADSDSNSYRKTVGIGLPPGISMQDMTFSWKVDGYTPCSASCLGGVQERRIACVRDYDQRAATPILCMDKPRPDIPTTRTCNDHPCPPRWNVSDFGPCSKPCGGGVMTRDVSCIHEVTRGNTVTVPNTQCPQPTPRTERFCNAINCPPFWEAGEWDRCSQPCGGGVRTRQLSCKQIIALGQIVDRTPSESHCTQPQPSVTRPCNNKPCGRGKETKQAASPNDATWPHIMQNEWKRKLSLSVRGHATVYRGITLKLRCPASKSHDRARLVWMKDHHYVNLQPSKIEIIPKSGVLKIKNTTFSDSGVYTCMVNDRAISNITLMVQPFHGENDRNNDMKPSRTRQSIEESNKIAVKPKGSIHDATLYADQQPGVSVIPLFDSGGGGGGRPGHESQLITPNTKLYSGSTSGASSIKTPFSYFLHGVVWVLWPLSKMFRLTEPEFSSLEENGLEKTGNNKYLDNSEQLQLQAYEDGLQKSFKTEESSDCTTTTNSPPIQNNNRRRNGHISKHHYRHNRDVGRSERLERTRGYGCSNSTTVPTRPKWTVGSWSKCSEVNCFTWNTSNRRRNVFCGPNNRSDDPQCDPSEKPPELEECYNANCRGIWRTESWSQCKSRCSAIGIKTRILKCVWFGSESPAGNACQLLPRPTVKKACRGPRCSKIEDCKDRIRHCPAIRTFNLCRVKQYQFHCCESCFNHKYSNRSTVHKRRKFPE